MSEMHSAPSATARWTSTRPDRAQPSVGSASRRVGQLTGQRGPVGQIS
jgi:hypothetical protein